MCESYKNGICNFLKNGICQKYKSSEDSLSLHCAGSWSEDKIAYFKYYAEMFSTGMKNFWPKRYYIDLFSGPGKCIIRENNKEIEGSCLVATKLKDKFTKCFFIDNNPVCIKDLKIRTKSENNIVFAEGDCNKIIEKIIDDIPEKSLSLGFIDPDSLQFKFDNYNILTKRKIDLIVNYPIGPIERTVSALKKKNRDSEIMDKFHPGWKCVLCKKTWGHSKGQNIKNLIGDYIKKVESLGYFSSDLVPFKNSKNTILYYLIAFSGSKKGIDFWKKASQGIQKRNPQLSFF